MLTEFTELWFKARSLIENRFNQGDIEAFNSYDKILCIILEEFNNIIEQQDNMAESDLFNLNIKQIDYGDYQGTLILTFARNTYQPTTSETFYTYVQYGSCSGCDALQDIIYRNYYSYEEYDLLDSQEKQDYNTIHAQQVKDLVTLSLHMVEKIKAFTEE